MVTITGDALLDFRFERVFSAPAVSGAKPRSLYSDAWATSPAAPTTTPRGGGESAKASAQDWSAGSSLPASPPSWYSAAPVPAYTPLTVAAPRTSYAGSTPAAIATPSFFGTSPAAAPTITTSGALSTTTSSNYSTAPWTISSGDGSYPDLGGTATFNPEVGATPGTVASATVTIILDISPTLGAVVVNNPFFEAIGGTTSTSLIMPTTGTTFTLNGVVSSPSYTLFNFQEATSGVISGGGTAGLTANGSCGSFLLEGTNTYTGGSTSAGARWWPSTTRTPTSGRRAPATASICPAAGLRSTISPATPPPATSTSTRVAATSSTTAGIGSIGQISFGSTLTLSSATTSSLYMEIGGTAASGNFDRITVAGTFTLNGTMFIATTGGYTIQNGDTFTIATAADGITQSTYTFKTTNASLGAGVTLTETVGANTIIVCAVPEPGTWTAAVGGLSILGSLQFARRRNRRA